MVNEILYDLFLKQKDFFNSRIRSGNTRQRIDKLQKLRSWILQNRSAIVEALHKDLRKPEVEADISDIKPVLWEIDHACRDLGKWMRPKRVSSGLALTGTRSKIVPQPAGVVLILSPWNFPFNLTIGPLVSAVAAGNCIFVKPSELSPNTSALMERMISELFPPEEAVVIQGDHSAAENLLKLPFNHIFFTGSPAVGSKVMKAASEHLSSVTLELGGCNPAIVDATANLRDAAQKIVFGKYLNAGQSCLSINYLFVEKQIYPQLLALLKEEFEKMYGKDLKSNPDYGRIINRRHFDRIQKLIKDTIEMGGEKITGGDTDEEQNFISPVILAHVPLDAPVMKEEIFGPVLPVVPYEKIEDVLSYVRNGQIPLALYIFTRSKAFADKIISETSAGTTCINDTTLQFIHTGLPFGGANHSGIGKSHGHYGFLAFSNLRPVLRQRIGFTSFKLIYPPYTAKVRKMADLILKYF